MQKENIVEIKSRVNMFASSDRKEEILGVKALEDRIYNNSFEKEAAYYAELSQARDLGELRKRIDDCMKRMGFLEYSVFRMDDLWEGGLKEFTTMSHDLMNSYFEHGFFEYDMSVSYYLKNTKAIYRSVFDDYVNQASFEIDLFTTMREIRRMNNTYAYYDCYNTLTKACNEGANAMLVVSGKGLSPSDLRLKVKGHENSLQLLCEAIDFVMTQKFGEVLGGPKEAKIVKLSPRPLKILSTLANSDLNVGQLADKLCISYVTASKHLEAARKAFCVKTNHAAIRQAIKQGLIQYE